MILELRTHAIVLLEGLEALVDRAILCLLQIGELSCRWQLLRIKTDGFLAMVFLNVLLEIRPSWEFFLAT